MATVRIGDFEWDEAKAAASTRKHGVTFEEAITVFLDALSVPLQDQAHHDRMILIGESHLGRLLLVVFTERGDILRIVSARPASKRERRAYEDDE